MGFKKGKANKYNVYFHCYPLIKEITSRAFWNGLSSPSVTDDHVNQVFAQSSSLQAGGRSSSSEDQGAGSHANFCSCFLLGEGFLELTCFVLSLCRFLQSWRGTSISASWMGFPKARGLREAQAWGPSRAVRFPPEGWFHFLEPFGSTNPSMMVGCLEDLEPPRTNPDVSEITEVKEATGGADVPQLVWRSFNLAPRLWFAVLLWDNSLFLARTCFLFFLVPLCCALKVIKLYSPETNCQRDKHF